MHGRSITFRHSLAGAEIHFYERGHADLTVEILSRDGRTMEIEFTGLEALLDFPGRDIASLVWFSRSAFLDQVTRRLYGNEYGNETPEELPFRSYQFLDAHDEVCLEIIAAHCQEKFDPGDIAVDT